MSILKNGGVPCYSLPETAARALISMTRYSDLKMREGGKAIKFNNIDMEKAKSIVEKAKDAGREFLSAEDVYNLLIAYNIPVAKWKLTSNSAEAVKAAQEIGVPVVIKVDAESIVHKSDVGGIALNLKEENVKSSVEKMEKKFAAEKPRFFVQEFLSGGKELIIGAKSEEGLGHLIMFGIGGVYVEVLRDVVFGITPITAVEAREMLSSIKSYPLLTGFRGEKGVDQKSLVEILQRVSQLVTELPMIQEIDLNPIVAYEDRVVVVDARIKI
jgi:acetyltransferase